MNYPSAYNSTQLAHYTWLVRTFCISKGWRGPDAPKRTFGDDIALLHSEVSEILEAYRVLLLNKHTEPDGKPDDVHSEIADVFIRLLDMCGEYNIDLDFEFWRKMYYNQSRSVRHGGKHL